jgi:AraC-like DNA-binding protein
MEPPDRGVIQRLVEMIATMRESSTMTSSDVRCYSEPSEFAAAIRGANVELNITSPGRFSAKVKNIDLLAVRVQQFQETLPRIMHSTHVDGRAVIAFYTRPGPCLFHSGAELHLSDVVRLAKNQSYFQRSTGPACWATMSLSVEDLRAAAIGWLGHDLSLPRSGTIVTPQSSVMAKLRRLHTVAGRLAECAPAIISDPEAARPLEQGMVEAIVACFRTNTVREDTSARRRHAVIMRCFRAMLEAEADRPLYVLELAVAIGVSARSLSMCCQEHLGMGAKRYLLLRRMHLARQALRAADPSVTNVTEVATQYGFWQFGRFAGEYISLFGELPSVTLYRKISRGKTAPVRFHKAPTASGYMVKAESAVSHY